MAEQIFLWVGLSQAAPPDHPEDFFDICPFSAKPHEVERVLNQIALLMGSSTVGVIPQEILQDMKSALNGCQAPHKRLVLATSGTDRSASMQWHLVQSYTPGEDIIALWKSGHPGQHLVGSYGIEEVDALLEECASLGA